MDQLDIEGFKLSALQYLADIISRYTGSEITNFFYKAGFPEIRHDGSTKRYFVYEALQQLQDGENGNPRNIVHVIEQLADPQEYINNQEEHAMIVQSLNELLSFYEHKVNDRGKVVPAIIKADTLTDFYISYDKVDQDWAEWIAWQLEDVGHSTTLESWDFRPGNNFILKMQEATIKAERTIIILSPNYLDSVDKQPEWAAAFKRDPTGQMRILLPIQVRPCTNKLPGLFTQIILIDLVGLSEGEARKALFDGIYHRRIKPTRAPDFPAASDSN
jgi:hypothetical protein